jgi:hypothetical protein
MGEASYLPCRKPAEVNVPLGGRCRRIRVASLWRRDAGRHRRRCPAGLHRALESQLPPPHADAADDPFAARTPQPSKIVPRSAQRRLDGFSRPDTGSPAADASRGGRGAALELDGPRQLFELFAYWAVSVCTNVGRIGTTSDGLYIRQMIRLRMGFG